MIFTDSPQDDEFQKRNKGAIAQEKERERLYDLLEEKGINCDICGNKYFNEELYPFRKDGDHTLIVCIACKDDSNVINNALNTKQ